MIHKLLVSLGIFMLTTSTLLANPQGVWRTQKSDTGASMDVTIQPCGNKYCGHMTQVYDSKAPPQIGIVIIKSMQDLGNGHFGGGLIYAPDTKKWYRSKMYQINENTLKVSVCVLKFICRSQLWTRQ